MCGKKVLDTKNYKQTSVWRPADQRTVLRENNGCEDETDGACLSSCHIYSICLVADSYDSLVLFFPALFEKNKDLEEVLASYCRISHHETGTVNSGHKQGSNVISKHHQLSPVIKARLQDYFVYFKLNALTWFFVFERLISVCNISSVAYLSELKHSTQ